MKNTASPTTISAAARSATIRSIAVRMVSGLRASSTTSSTPAAAAASRMDASCCAPVTGLAGFVRTPTRLAPGTASVSSASRLEPSWGEMIEKPVMFPPGRARLATRPRPTGSLVTPITIGTLSVAFLAAIDAAPLSVTITLTGICASSAAALLSRSGSPCAERNSSAWVRPSMCPSLRISFLNATNNGLVSSWPKARSPTRAVEACCARAAQGQAAAHASSTMKARRLIGLPPGSAHPNGLRAPVSHMRAANPTPGLGAYITRTGSRLRSASH